MLAEIIVCAHRLGKAFGREAEREVDWARKRALFDLCERCFFGVRVAIALKLRLARAAVTGAQPVRGDAREAADAAARPGATSAALQPLTARLARATGDAGPVVRPASKALRTRFAGASAMAMVTPAPRAGPAAHSFAAHGLRPRAATGPLGR